MGLITKTVMVRWNVNNRKWYESKGYLFTKWKDQFEVKVEDLIKGSHIKVQAKCDNCKKYCNNEWKVYLKYVHSNGTYYCKECGTKLFGKPKEKQTKLTNSKSFYDWCYENLDENEADKIINCWDYEKNKISPKYVCYSSHGINEKGYWFKCDKHPEHESEIFNIHNFVIDKHKRNFYCKQCNSIAEYLLDNYGTNALDKYWNYDKNKDINPWEINKSSDLKIWWKCVNGKHDDYLRTVAGANKYEFRCPQCSQERDESVLQEKVRLYLENLNNKKYIILHEYNCTIRPINPKTKNILPFDNEIKELKLVIEVHGVQHYEEQSGLWLNENFDLHKRQLYDRYKRIYAKSKGYYYLEIPYWTDNKQKEWKTLINNKINKILNERK